MFSTQNSAKSITWSTRRTVHAAAVANLIAQCFVIYKSTMLDSTASFTAGTPAYKQYYCTMWQRFLIHNCNELMFHSLVYSIISTNTHTRLTTRCLGLPGWASIRKVKPIWILLKQETVSGSGISCAICKSAPCSRQITTPAPHQSVFYRPDALPAAQPTATNHWRQLLYNKHKTKY